LNGPPLDGDRSFNRKTTICQRTRGVKQRTAKAVPAGCLLRDIIVTTTEENMNREELGKLSYEVSPQALKEIVESGRVLEFANTVAASAASEIHAQIVDQISRAAIGGATGGGISVSAVNVFEGGDFGTVPKGPKGPRPKVGVIFDSNALSHVVDIAQIGKMQR
jgi:hypothetical protein